MSIRPIDLLEACYKPSTCWRDWATGVCAAAAPILRPTRAVSLIEYAVSPDGKIQSPWTVNSEEAQDLVEKGWKHPIGWAAAINREPEGRFYLSQLFSSPAPLAVVLSELPPELRDFTRTLLPQPSSDGLGIFTGTCHGRGGILGWVLPDVARPRAGERRQWDAISEHLAAGHALHASSTPDAWPDASQAAAVLSPGGQLLDADECTTSVDLRTRLTEAVRRMDRARCRRRKCSDEEALELWRAFISGHYSLVESFDRAGRRTILALRVRSDLRALGASEAAVARLAARGWSNKAMASELGLASSTVARQLAKALRKLGCSNRTELAVRASTPYWGG